MLISHILPGDRAMDKKKLRIQARELEIFVDLEDTSIQHIEQTLLDIRVRSLSSEGYTVPLYLHVHSHDSVQRLR
jgi:hypothetical protein